jgi:hypothetical protein
MKTIQAERPKKSVGRKWFDGKNEEAVLTKCKEVWAIGGSDAEAAFYAEITGASLSRYLSSHPKVGEFRNDLHAKPVLKARQTIVKDLDNPESAKWYLQRKVKREFSERSEFTGADGHPLLGTIVLPPRLTK